MMTIWLDIHDSPLNKDLNTIGEVVTFQVTGTVLELEQEGLELSGGGKPHIHPYAPRRARVFVHAIQKQSS